MFKGQIALSALSTSVVLALRLFVQAGILLLVARMLGAEHFGAFSSIAAIAVMLGCLSTFGMHLVLLRDVSRSDSNSILTQSSVLNVALPTTLLCGCILFLAFLTILEAVSAVPILSTGGLFAIGISEIIMLPLLALRAAELHGRGSVAASQMLLMLPLILRLLVALFIVIFSVSDALSVYAYGYLAVSTIVLAISMLAVRAPWPGVMAWRLPNREVLATSGGFAAINLSRLAPLELDKALAGRLLALEAAGVYAAASRIVAAAVLPITAMNLSALPRLFREEGSQSPQKRRLLIVMYTVALVLGVFMASGLWLAAPVFPWLFGSDYQDAESVVKLLCLAIPGMTLRAVSGNVLMALGKHWLRIAFETCGMIVLTAMAIALMGKSGASGMAIALICSEWSMAVGGAAFVGGHMRQLRVRAANTSDS